jgi:hypothetical protein
MTTLWAAFDSIGNNSRLVWIEFRSVLLLLFAGLAPTDALRFRFGGFDLSMGTDPLDIDSLICLNVDPLLLGPGFTLGVVVIVGLLGVGMSVVTGSP